MAKHSRIPWVSTRFEVAKFLKTLYINILLPYEQYFVQKKGIVEINCTSLFFMFHLSLGPVAIKLNDVPKAYQIKAIETPTLATPTPKIIKIKTPRSKKTDTRHESPPAHQTSTAITQTSVAMVRSDPSGRPRTHHLPQSLVRIAVWQAGPQIHALNALQALAHHDKISGHSRSFSQIIDEMVKLLMPCISAPKTSQQDIQ